MIDTRPEDKNLHQAISKAMDDDDFYNTILEAAQAKTIKQLQAENEMSSGCLDMIKDALIKIGVKDIESIPAMSYDDAMISAFAKIRAELTQARKDHDFQVGKVNFRDSELRGERKQIKQLQAEKEKLRNLLHYLNGTQSVTEAQFAYPAEHRAWAIGQEKGSVTGDFEKWLIEQALKGE